MDSTCVRPNRIRFLVGNDGSISVEGYLAESADIYDFWSEEDAQPLRFKDLKEGQVVSLKLYHRVATHLYAPLIVENLSNNRGYLIIQ